MSYNNIYIYIILYFRICTWNLQFGSETWLSRFSCISIFKDIVISIISCVIYCHSNNHINHKPTFAPISMIAIFARSHCPPRQRETTVMDWFKDCSTAPSPWEAIQSRVLWRIPASDSCTCHQVETYHPLAALSSAPGAVGKPGNTAGSIGLLKFFMSFRFFSHIFHSKSHRIEGMPWYCRYGLRTGMFIGT